MARGKAALLVSAFPGAAVHDPPVAEPPGAVTEETVPVVLPLSVPIMITGIAGGKTAGWLVLEAIGVVIDIGMVVAGLVTVAELIGATRLAEVADIVEVTLITDGESSTASGEQLTLVPGSVGFCVSGGEANVVAGAPGTVAGEK